MIRILLALSVCLSASSVLAESCVYYHSKEARIFEGFSFYPSGDVKYEVSGLRARPGYRYRIESDGQIIVPNDKGYFALAINEDGSLAGKDPWLKESTYRPQKGGPFDCDGSFDLVAHMRSTTPEPKSCYREANEMRLSGKVVEARSKAKGCCFERQEAKVCNLYGVLGLFTGGQTERSDVLKAFNVACQAGDQNACDNLKLAKE